MPVWSEELPNVYKLSTPHLDKGTCGASADTIVARNLLMMVGRGTAAHASHAQHVASALPPVWHFGSCVDNARVVILISALAGKLGVGIKDLPIAASAAEWVTEKAAAIGIGAVAMGVTVHLGVTPPVLGSPAVASLLTSQAEEVFGGKFIVEIDPEIASVLIFEHITEKRKKMGLGV